jgi:hypothetical protein
MRIGVRLPSSAMVVAVIALGLSIGGGAFAASSVFSAGGSLGLCIASNGGLRARTSKRPCTHHEKLVTVNVKGQRGPAGAPGQTGMTGPKGPKGDTGSPGPGAITFRFDSAAAGQANPATLTDGPLTFTATCSSTAQTNFSLALNTGASTTVYTEGLFALNGATATPNLNAIPVPSNFTTTIIGDGSGTTEQHDSTLLIDQGTASWFVNADVQVTNSTHRCQLLMLVVPST